jgi:hypothetical protein
VSEERIRELRDRAARARYIAELPAGEHVRANLISYAEQLEMEASKLEESKTGVQ